MDTLSQQTPTLPPENHHIPDHRKWSWGGFMFDPALPIATKRYRLLFWYLLLLAPVVNIIAIIGLKIYFGLKGRELARTSTAFANEDQYKGFMDAYDRVGFVAFWVTVVLCIIGFGASLLGLGFFLSGVEEFSGWKLEGGSISTLERELCEEMGGEWSITDESCDYDLNESLEAI